MWQVASLYKHLSEEWLVLPQCRHAFLLGAGIWRVPDKLALTVLTVDFSTRQLLASRILCAVVTAFVSDKSASESSLFSIVSLRRPQTSLSLKSLIQMFPKFARCSQLSQLCNCLMCHLITTVKVNRRAMIRVFGS